MTPDPPAMLERLCATFPTLDEWGVTLATSFVPAEGSALAVDDRDWVPVPVSQVAVMGLGSARDHLHAVRVLIEARQLFPFAQSTLIRGAVIGAAQAVWVLEPDGRELRLERARLLAAHMYAEHGKYLDLLRRLAPEPHEGTEAVFEHVQQRQAELRELRVQADQHAALNTTEMVKTAALAAFGAQMLADETESIWRITSGAAHGFAWSLLGQSDTQPAREADARGIAEFAAAGGIDRIANGYLCGFHLARHGWELLRRRSISQRRL
jgi:hypothetical protein